MTSRQLFAVSTVVGFCLFCFSFAGAAGLTMLALSQ